MIKDIIKKLKPSSTLLINEVSNKMEKEGKKVYGIGIYAIIRLWDTKKNKAIRDIDPFLNPDDLEFGALVDTTQPDGRPMSQPSLPGNTPNATEEEKFGAIFKALTLAGIQSGASFKINL